MKKIVSLLLAVALVMGLGITAFAAGSPTSDGNKGGNGSATTNVPRGNGGKPGMGIYNSDDEEIAFVPAGQIKRIAVGNANKLSAEDKEAFLAAYEEAKNIEGKKVKYFYWLDIPEEYKEMDGFAYGKYEFTCTGENVQVTVNGKEMEVEQTGKNTYFAKLTEFGAVAILCD